MRSLFLCLLGLVTVSSSYVNAASVSYTGSFVSDNDVRLFTASFSVPSTVTIRTFSYAGGTNGAGTIIPNGGFDTTVSLFDGSGNFISENDEAPWSRVDPVTNNAYDAYLETNLAAGSYTVALTQYDSVANGPTLSAGFSETDPFFTQVFGCSNAQFCDIDGNNRTSNYALDISSTPTVPEPTMPALFAVGLSAIGIVKARKLIFK